MELRRVPLAWILAAPCLLTALGAQAQSDFVRRARILEIHRHGVHAPVGLAFAGTEGVFLVASEAPSPAASPQVHRITHGDELAGSAPLTFTLADPINLAFDDWRGQLLSFDPGPRDLVVAAWGPAGAGEPTRIPAAGLGMGSAEGMAMDPGTGRLFLLDAAAPRILVVDLDAWGGLEQAVVTQLALPSFSPGSLRGIAFDPSSGHLHVLAPAALRLYEITPTGVVTASRDLAPFQLRNPQGIAFAPSGDLTDDPEETSLYVAEAGTGGGPTAPPGQISELSLIPVPAPPPARIGSPRAAAATAGGDVATLVQTIDTSQLSPPSPDPMGIAYLDSSDTLLMSDSEVNEIPQLFTGDNLFEIAYPTGALLRTGTTISYSDEPTGLAFDPATGILFISDDNAREVWIVDPGPDGLHGTGDDAVSSFDTTAYASLDPEGIAFDRAQRFLYVVDGVNAEVYEVDPGPDEVFEGAAGDDVVTSFDTETFGALDPEGIAYDSQAGTLFLIGSDDETLFEVTTGGALLRTVDYSAASANQASGLGFGPGSAQPGVPHLYVTDRGVDNNNNPNENDGKLYEIALPGITPGNDPPMVDAGPDDAIPVSAQAVLDGSVVDDGIPGGPVPVLWSQVGGSGTVSFADPRAEDTTATFSAGGTYVLRLSADDGELSGHDEKNVVVTGSGGEIVFQVAVSASSDDAEEGEDDAVRLSSGDLDMVLDGGQQQTVGIRFTGVGVPGNVTVLNAYIQFQARALGSAGTALTLEGEAADDAGTFLEVDENISARHRTAAQAIWAPAAWTTVGARGPDQRTSDLSAIVQEIVDRPGWSPGNAQVFIVSGSGAGTRVAESYDGAFGPLLHIEYLNQPPQVAITAPPDGTSVFEGQSLGFSGTADDPEEGDLSAGLAWSSESDGPIGSGAGFQLATLSVGSHTITAQVVDAGGLQGSDQIGLTVLANTAPVVSLTSPPEASSFVSGQPVDFAAGASDPEEGDLSAGLAWSSDRDGPIGSGAGFQLATLSVGSHTITAQVVDAGGLQGSDQIGVSVIARLPALSGSGLGLLATALLAVARRRLGLRAR